MKIRNQRRRKAADQNIGRYAGFRFSRGKGGGLLREAFCVKPFPRKEQVSAGGWYNDFRVAAGMILPGQKRFRRFIGRMFPA